MKHRNLILLASIFLVITTFAQDNIFSKKFIKQSMLDAFEWQQANPKHALTDWTNGAYYAGVSQAWKATKNKAYYKGMIAMGDATDWKPGKRWYHADDITICQTYLDVYKKNKKHALLEPTKEVLDHILLDVDEFAWKYPKIECMNWWWCDALFMGPPVFVKYGVLTGQDIYLKASDKWYKQAYDLLFDQDENLWARDLNYVWDKNGNGKKENGKKIFWSRGNGWVFGGLAILLEDMPKDYPNRAFYESIFIKMAAKLKAIQPADGAWRSSLLYPEGHDHGETSGTGFYAFGMAWGIRNGYLKEAAYLPVVKSAWKALVSNQQENGMVGFVQPIGAAPSLQVSKDLSEVYGTGAYLCAGSEILKLKIKE